MTVEPFDAICHDVALAEMRVCEVPGPSTLGPGGEFYCTEPGCDCRRVVVQFLEAAAPSNVVASVSYGWEKAGFYKKWSRSAEGWREMAGVTLGPLAEKGPYAEGFLKIFDHIIKDRQVVAAFRRHYRMVREIIARP